MAEDIAEGMDECGKLSNDETLMLQHKYYRALAQMFSAFHALGREEQAVQMLEKDRKLLHDLLTKYKLCASWSQDKLPKDVFTAQQKNVEKVCVCVS